MVDFNGLRKKAEAKAKDLKAKAEDYIDDNREKIDGTLDKAGGFVAKKTGKTEQVDKALGKVKGALDRNPATDGRPDEPPTA